MSTYSRNVRRLRNMREPRTAEVIFGRTGLLDDNGDVYPDPAEGLDTPGLIWFRPVGGGGEAFTVINTRVSNRKADLPVRCRLTRPRSRQYAVEEIDPEIGPRELGDMMGVYNRPDAPSEANQLPLSQAYIRELRLRLDEDGDLNLYLEPGYYTMPDGTREYFAGDTYDASGDVPAEDEKVALVFGITSATNTLEVYVSAAVERMTAPIVGSQFSPADWVTHATAAIAAGIDMPLWGVPLLGTDTEFVTTGVFECLKSAADLFGIELGAADIPYAATDASDWNGGVSPADVEEALDQLADRVEAIVAAGLSEPYIQLQDRKTQNTQGGGLTASTWNTRTLNTEVSDTGSICSLSSNQFTLPAGTYRIHARVPAYQVQEHQARLRNITDTATTIDGSSAYASTTSGNALTFSFITGLFTIAGTKTFEVQHNCAATNGTNGAGVRTNLGPELYTDVEIWKLLD